MDLNIILAVSISVCHFILADAVAPMNQRPVPWPPRSNGQIFQSVINQLVDHDNADTEYAEYYLQRYFYNKEFVRSDDHPIFLLVDGEFTSDPGWLHGGQWNNWAKKHGAMMYELEHRFFGESLPRPDLSLESLRHLSSYQALGDIRNFIMKMNEENNYTSKNKWILFGGSYPGVLAAWSRLHMPDIVTGAIASSAPVEAILNFSDYIGKGVAFSLDYFSNGCAESVHQAILAVQALLESNSPEDLDTLKSKFQICSDPTNWLDRAQFFHDNLNPLITTVQSNSLYYNDRTISYACETFLNNPQIEEPIDRLSEFLRFKKQGCPNSYYSSVRGLKKTEYNANEFARQWTYLTCNEFGWFMTSEDKNSFASDTMPLDFFINQCKDVFGEEYNLEGIESKVNSLNSYNQGTDIQTTNIVFIHGSIDPYHYAGIIKHPTEDMPYILVNGSAHTDDIYDTRPNDSKEMRDARKVAEDSIAKWLAEQ